MKDNIIDIMARITCILGSLLATCLVVYSISASTSDAHAIEDASNVAGASTFVDSNNTGSFIFCDGSIILYEPTVDYGAVMRSMTPEDWAEIATQNSQKKPDSFTAQVLLTIGTIPSWDMLRNFGISYVYDENGGAHELSGSKTVSKFQSFFEMPSGDVYVDMICSGRYVAVGGQLFIVFNSGMVSEVNRNLTVAHDTIGIDLDTGVIQNIIDEGPNQ